MEGTRGPPFRVPDPGSVRRPVPSLGRGLLGGEYWFRSRGSPTLSPSLPFRTFPLFPPVLLQKKILLPPREGSERSPLLRAPALPRPAAVLPRPSRSPALHPLGIGFRSRKRGRGEGVHPEPVLTGGYECETGGRARGRCTSCSTGRALPGGGGRGRGVPGAL